MGFPPLEKTNKKHRKGLWSPEEDERLRTYILEHGHGCWSSVPSNAGLARNGKSCRLRWINYLRPGLKRGAFTIAEEDTILTLHAVLGNKWSRIAHHLPGRSDNEIKNCWHSYLKKRAAAKMEEIQRLQSSDQDLSLPKVIFAEWLSLDMDLGDDFKSIDNVDNNHSPNNGETLLDDGLLHNHELETLLPIDDFSGDFCAII